MFGEGECIRMRGLKQAKKRRRSGRIGARTNKRFRVTALNRFILFFTYDTR